MNVCSRECAVLLLLLWLCGIGQSAESVSEKQAEQQDIDIPDAAVYVTLGDYLAVSATCLQG